MGSADTELVTPPTTGWTCSTCGRQFPAEFALCPHDATPRADHVVVAADAMIGEVLGRTYRVVRVLGQGGMARLYEVEHLRIDARFAVKVIHDDLARDPDLLARFEREARAAGRIHSEHVVRLVDVLRTADNRPCLVTELLDGEDMQQLLDRVTKLSPEHAIPVARQICRAVAAAHAVGVVHRDLKPSNIFLCRSDGIPVVKVFDFGVAKLDDDEKLTRTEAVVGTAAYMAPEQARRAADAGPLADVYSIGAILYHMLTGEPPYGNVPAVSRFALVLHEEPARLRTIDPSIPPGIEAVIQNAMARERPSRVQSALELEAQLASFDKPTTAPTIRQSATNLPAPAEASASDIALRARLSRPVAVAIAVASSLASGAWIATMLAAIANSSSGSERALIALIGFGAAAGIGVLHARVLRPRWRSSPAVSRYIRPFARALIGGVITLGALELIAHGSNAVFGTEPIGPTWRVVLAGLAAGVGLGWQRFELDQRLRRWIG